MELLVGFYGKKIAWSKRESKSQFKRHQKGPCDAHPSVCRVLWHLQRCGQTLMLHLQWIQKTRVELSGFKIHLYVVYAVQYVSSLCWCGRLLLKTLYNPTLYFCLFCFFVVEEILVCFDGSQPEILQGLYCGRGEFITSLSSISMLSSCFYLLVGLCFLRLLTWMVRLTCQPAAMWQSTRHSATMDSKYM